MGYQINLRGAVSRSIRRTYRRRLEKIGRVLAKAGPDAERIHEARTSVKKARALLRLLRHDLGASLFEAETAALREAGRALSTVRDAVVLVEALDGLTPEGSEEDRAALAPLRAALAARRDRCVERSDEEAARAARAVAGALERADEVVPAHHGWKALARGLDRAYRRTRDRAERAFTTGGDEDLHALRKAVKDLTYQARFLRPLDEPALRAEGAGFAQLGDLLGDDHDLAVLRAVASRPGEDADPAARARLDALTAARRAELEREAQSLAERLLAEPPALRLARLESAFRAARDRAQRGEGEAPVPHFA